MLLTTVRWRALKNKITLDAAGGVGGNTTVSGFDASYLHLFNFPLLLIKKKKKIHLQSKAKHAAIHKSTFDYWDSTSIPFNGQKLVLIFGHILLKRPCRQDPSFSIRPLKDFFVLALCDLNFDTESNWLHREEPKVIILMD